MDLNFKLNDRQDSNLLSDRIINSADEVFEHILSDDYIQKFLMKGKMTDVNVMIAHRRHKDAIDNIDDSYLKMAFKNVEALTDISEEKQFFNLCDQKLKQPMVDYIESFEQLFGKLDPKLVNSPLSQTMYSYKIFTIYNTTNGPFLKGLMPILATTMVCDRTLDYLKQNPNYSPNKLAKMLCYEDYNLKQLYGPLRQMIDRRGDQVSEEEVKELSELFKRAVVYERLVENHEYSGGQWFDG